jgi:hypothetical protein
LPGDRISNPHVLSGIRIYEIALHVHDNRLSLTSLFCDWVNQLRFPLEGRTMNKRMIIFMAITLVAFALMSNAAMAQSYSGNWPVNVNLPPHFARTACLSLVDNGTGGQHSGSASLSGPIAGNTTLTGTFQVISHLLVATIQSGDDNGEVDYMLFIAPAADGDLSKGVYEEPGFLSGATIFGTKGGCSNSQ